MNVFSRLLIPALALAVLLLAQPHAAQAHSLYIQSSRSVVSTGKASPLFFCYGHHIPVDDGLRPGKLDRVWTVAPDGTILDMPTRQETGLQSSMVQYDQPGTWVLAAQTNPGFYTMYIDTKGRERHTIKPMSAIKDQASEIITSLYSKQFTKTYVVCDEPSVQFPGRIGLDLELVPVTDISTLAPGDELVLKVFFNGQRFQGQGTWDATYNGFSTQAEDNFHPKTEVQGDTLRIPIPNAGRWFVRYSFKIDAQGEEASEYKQMKYTSTLTFEIPNERKTEKPEGR